MKILSDDELEDICENGLKEKEYLMTLSNQYEMVLNGSGYEERPYVGATIAKLNKNKTVPKKLTHFNRDIYLIEMDYVDGWKVFGTEISYHNQFVLIYHPTYNVVKIKYKDFIHDIIPNDAIIDGMLQSKYQYVNQKLIKEEDG